MDEAETTAKQGRRTNGPAFVAVLVASLLSTVCQADVVFLMNGDRISGTVDSVTGGRLLIETGYAGRVALTLDAIASVATEETFEIRLTDGTQLDGQFVVEGESQNLRAVGGELQPFSLMKLASAGQNKLKGANLGREWSNHADLSAAVSSGNTQTEAYNVLVESALTLARSEHRVSLLISEEQAEGQTTKDQLDLDYEYKRFFSEKWYGSGNAEYFQDPLKDVDSRITAGGGIGYQFWNNSFGALSAELGVNVVVEELDGESEENPALRWALRYKRYLWSKRLELFHGHSILVIPDADRGEVIDSSTGVRLAVNDRIDASLRVDVQHETKPPAGNHKTDVTYSLGMGIRF
ncbi:MAG: DUF481 domain-containing protein [Gammaproteobacteria bacterium]|nr:DUF481 domain-containing protein [Gammaproteobacteria bacterium]